MGSTASLFRKCLCRASSGCQRLSVVLVVSVHLLGLLGPASADETARHRVVLVVCDRLTWEDLNAACPFLVSQMDRSALGLMNTTVRGPQSATSAMLTLASGQQATAEPSDEQAFDTTERLAGQSEKAGRVYARRTGAPPQSGRTIVHLNTISLARRQFFGLGAALAKATPPRRILIVGNADTDVPERRAALLALDAQGTAVGDVALVSRDEKSNPFGLRDATTVLARYAATTDADVFVVVLGDLARVEAARPLLTPDRYQAARQAALERLDAFFVQLLAVRHLDITQVDCVLVSPCPPAVPGVENTYLGGLRPGVVGTREVSSSVHPSVLTRDDVPDVSIPGTSSHLIFGRSDTPEVWEQLTPVMALGPDFPPGLLASPTTRTAGLVANTDIAPTILRLLSIPLPDAMTGRPMQVQTGETGQTAQKRQIKAGKLKLAGLEERQLYLSRLDFVTTLNAQAWTNVRLPRIILVCLFSLLLLAAVFVYWRGEVRSTRWLLPVLLGGVNVPLAVLLATILIPPTLLEYGLRIAACTIALTGLNYLLARALRMPPLVTNGLLNIGLLLFDVGCGQPLLNISLLSRFATSNHHAYGAGWTNYGLLVGYALLSGLGWWKKTREKRIKKEDMKKKKINDVAATLMSTTE